MAENELRETQAKQSEQIRTLFTRVEELKTLTESVQKLAISLERLTLAQQTTAKKVETLSADVEGIKLKPAKRWENAVNTGMTILITAVITYLLASIGVK